MKRIGNLFKGRINRRNFWLGLLTSAASLFVLALLAGMLGNGANAIFGFLVILDVIAVIIFNVSLQVRRWHDLGKSGFFALFNLIPYAGIVIIIIVGFFKGQSKTNKYGAVPSKTIKYPDQILNL